MQKCEMPKNDNFLQIAVIKLLNLFDFLESLCEAVKCQKMTINFLLVHSHENLYIYIFFFFFFF